MRLAGTSAGRAHGVIHEVDVDEGCHQVLGVDAGLHPEREE